MLIYLNRNSNEWFFIYLALCKDNRSMGGMMGVDYLKIVETNINLLTFYNM